MSFKNEQVVEAWKYGSTARSGNGSLRTDGKTLYSYRLAIGLTCNGQKIVYNFMGKGKAVSSTTSAHVGLAMRVADVVEEPNGEHVEKAQEVRSRG